MGSKEDLEFPVGKSVKVEEGEGEEEKGKKVQEETLGETGELRCEGGC